MLMMFVCLPTARHEAFVAFAPNKKDITVAVIDTGLALNHSQSVNRYVKQDDNQFVGFNLTGEGLLPEDHIGHGTLVAKAMTDYLNYFKATNISFIPMKYYGEMNNNLVSMVESIHLAVDMKVDVINISASGSDFNPFEYEALKRAEEQNILVVVAAGNDSEDAANAYPCAYNLKNLVCVGSLDKQAQKLPSSNYGKKVNLYTNGIVEYVGTENRVGTQTGTSFAAPRITAAAALYWSKNPKLNMQDVRQKLLSSVSYNQDLAVFSWTKLVGGRQVAGQ